MTQSNSIGSRKMSVECCSAAGRLISSGGISFFLVDPLDLAIFVGGAVLGVLLGLAMVVRPSPAWVPASGVLGVAWLFAFGGLTITKLSELPIEQLLSIVWVLAFGVAAAVVAYLRQPSALRV